jgi:hypothetical protein
MSTSSIDELLLSGGNASQPQTPEHQYSDEPEEIEELEPEEAPESEEHEPEAQEDSQEVETKPLRDTDEYGNEKEPENEVIRDRLKKQAESMNRKHQAEIDSLRAQLAERGASQQIQQAAGDFEYNPDAAGDWQQQLASFVKQTVNSMGREQDEARNRQQEHEVQQEFESKLITGMANFSDFQDVIRALPCEITNPMTLATRAMSDPAAFLYAAAKRNPQELERISKLRDPYAQMTEMGKLEERMRRNKPTTKAPRPLGRTNEDAQSPVSKKKAESTIEDLIAKSDARKLQRMKGRPSGRR